MGSQACSMLTPSSLMCRCLAQPRLQPGTGHMLPPPSHGQHQHAAPGHRRPRSQCTAGQLLLASGLEALLVLPARQPPLGPT